MALAVILVFLAGACTILPPGLFAPTATPSPTPKGVCANQADLLVAIDELRSLDVSEAGVLALGESLDAALTEARLLIEAVGEELRPLVLDLVVSLENLRATVDELADQATLGSKIASIGESLIEIGETMDALEVRLRTRCESAESPEPA